MKDLLKLREKMRKKRPKFKRQESFRHKKLKEKWRKPRGINSKLKIEMKPKGRIPKVGYRSPKAVRGLDRSGYKEVIVRNVKDLEKINSEKEICVIASGVGKKKRLEILDLAQEKNIKVTNTKFNLKGKT